MNFTLECEQEVDGRWIAEVPKLPGVLAYGSSSADAMSKTEVLALRVIADKLEKVNPSRSVSGFRCNSLYE
jgi:predicted RNase H-like HicB family nuclease